MTYPPATWTEGSAPTADELVQWIRSFGPEHDLSAATKMVSRLQQAASRAAHCFEAGHDFYPADIASLQAHIRRLQEGEEYQRLAGECRRLEAQVSRLTCAWWSARRRGVWRLWRLMDERDRRERETA